MQLGLRGWCAVLVFGGSLIGVKATVFVVEDAVLCEAAKVVVRLAWGASPMAAMVVGACGTVSSCETPIWCSLRRRWSYGAPGLLVVGRSVPRWVR